MNVPTPIRPDAPAGAPVTNSQVMRVLAFLLVVLPIAIPVNVILWRVAVGAW